MTKNAPSPTKPRGSETPFPASVLKVAGSNPGRETQGQEAVKPKMAVIAKVLILRR